MERLAPDYYVVLGVAPSATAAQIKAAYREQAKRYHPDHNPGFVEPANKRLIEVSEAYEHLGDPVARAAYDSARNAATQPERLRDAQRTEPPPRAGSEEPPSIPEVRGLRASPLAATWLIAGVITLPILVARFGVGKAVAAYALGLAILWLMDRSDKKGDIRARQRGG